MKDKGEKAIAIIKLFMDKGHLKEISTTEFVTLMDEVMKAL